MISSRTEHERRRYFLLSLAAMVVVIVASNVLVQFPINDWLTWGAFTYPVAFLVSDLANRRLGPTAARRIVYGGFAIAVACSIIAATPRIALASGTAFLAAQLLDIAIFSRLRRFVWWLPPLVSSGIASIVDTFLFFSLAFAGQGLPWAGWALGDLAVKLSMALVMLLPFRALAGDAPAAAPSPGR